MNKLLFKCLFVVVLVMTGFTLSWAGSGSLVIEGKPITGKLEVGGGTIEIPNSTSLPAACTIGEIYMDTNATSGQRCYLCESENVWALQGDGGGGVDTSGTPVDNDFAKFTDVDTIEGRSYSETRSDLGLGTAALRAAEDSMTDGSNLPDGHAVKTYGDANWAGAVGDKIIEGNTSVEVIDTGDGYIIFTEDGTEVGRFTGGDLKLGTGGDPADSGVIRLKNADKVVWEASPAGTDIEGISVDSDEIIQIGAAGASGLTIVPPVTLNDRLNIGEHDIKLDSLLSTDGKYSGITCDGVLGATLAFGDLVYLSTTDQRWELADADAEATAGDVMLAIVLAGGNDGDTKLLLLQGFIRENDWNFTSYGQALFVSCTAGDMTATAPSASGDIVKVIGYASTFADQIYFNPNGTWLEIS